MKHLLIIALFSVMTFGLAQAQFEGVVETRNLTTDATGAVQQFTITMWIKNDRIRVQVSSTGDIPASLMIYRLDRKVTWMINDDDHSYFEILRDTQSPNHPEQPTPSSKAGIQQTGRKKKILGYVCEQILIKRADQVTELWGTKKLSDLAKTTSLVLGETEGGALGGWPEEIRKLDLYPLSASTRIDGKVIEAQETTNVSRTSVRSDLFELPSSYRKQEVGESGQ